MAYLELVAARNRPLVHRAELGVRPAVAPFPYQVFANRHRVLHPLQNATPHRQRDDLVSADSQIFRLFVDGEEAVHDCEDLLHNGVLAQVVLAFNQLTPGDAVGADARDAFGGVDSTHVVVHVVEFMNPGYAFVGTGFVHREDDRREEDFPPVLDFADF